MKRRKQKERSYEVSRWVKGLTDSAYRLKWKHAPGVKYTGSIADRDRFFKWYVDIMVSQAGQLENLLIYLEMAGDKTINADELLEKIIGKEVA